MPTPKEGLQRAEPPHAVRPDESLDGVTAAFAASQPRLAGSNARPDSFAADLDPAIWINRLIKNESEGEVALQSYRIEFQPLFPFVVLPADVSFIDVRETKPLLLLVVLMMTSPHASTRQLSIAKKLRHIISYSVLVKGNHSLDVLQGLLIFVNWYHLHLQLGSQLCNQIHLVMSVMTELRLNKSADSKNFKLGLGLLGYFGKAGSVPSVMATIEGRDAPREPTTRTSEERRTFLGCFFLTSIVVDFAACMDLLSERLDQATASVDNTAGQLGHNSVARAASRLFSGLKTAHKAKYTAEADHPGQPSGSYPSLIGTMPLFDEFFLSPATSFSEFLDEEFWQQFS
ncbi:hypothetical protein H2200_001329 [Cladophialophora chaetospira]|uniref:Xylanolytic transcriptional activator regulatory domain-containing protein n=1 Tax=Cladophialophora chaetospira TaxID=386627 RepID=A0AA38XKY9_9EURO|nr:hypothetical protein H2200_001329 [Cladophialophora chaetospira]